MFWVRPWWSDLKRKQRFTLSNQAAAEMYFNAVTFGECVIYSHNFITLQAAILPAKNVHELQLFVDKWVPVVGAPHRFFSWVSQLLSVSRLCCRSHHFATAGCCGTSASSPSGRSWEEERRKLTKAALPASVADAQLKALKLGFKPPKWKDGGWGRAHHYYYSFLLHLPTAQGAWRYSEKVWRPLWCENVNIRGPGFSWIFKCVFTLQPLRTSVRCEQRDQEREWESALE